MSPAAVDELLAQLSGSRNDRERASLAGQVLSALGQLVRAGQSAPEPPLKSLSREDVEGWLAVVDPAAIRGDLERAAEAGLEALLADVDSEALEYRTWAFEALRGRDELDAAFTGLAAWEQRATGLTEAGRRVRDRISQELARVDSLGPSLSRRLVAVNAARRNSRDKLVGEHRARAWWFAARAECDALASLWRSEPTAPEAHCADCARDRSNARLAERPPGRCATEDELWKLDEGELPTARRRLLEKHARNCAECALALQAVAVPLFDDAAVTPESNRFSSAAPEVVASRPEFQVLLFRGPRARLVVAPAPGQRLAAAALQLAKVSGALSGVASSGGLEVELGKLERQRGKLRVELPGGRSVELDVEL